MLHPVGSLPARVYWTRRLAGVGVVLLLALTPLLLVGGGGESAAGDARPPAAGASETPQLELVPGEALQSTTPASTTGSGTATASSGSTASGSGAPGTASGSAPTTSASPASSPPPPAACGDDVIAVAAGSTKPQWPAAGRPVLLMTVTNVGTVPCTRDVGMSQQEWGIFDGPTRLWGSNDCQAEPGTDVRTLQPGGQVTLQVQWSGMSSDRVCAEPRDRLAPGEYQLRATIGPVQSGNFALVLT